PGPVPFRTSSGMNPHKSTATMNVILKSLTLLLVVEGLVVAVCEDDGLVTLQIGVREHARIVRMHHLEMILRADLLDRLYGLGNVVVNVSFLSVEGRAVVGVDK